MDDNITVVTTRHSSLPPLIEGKVHGYLIMKVDEVLWCRKSPGSISVSVKWWGEREAATFRPVDVKSVSDGEYDETTYIYEILTSIQLFEAYLKDFGSLIFTVIDQHTNTAIGCVTVNSLTRMVCETLYQSYFPIINSYGNRIGDLHVCFKLKYFPCSHRSSKVSEKKSSKTTNSQKKKGPCRSSKHQTSDVKDEEAQGNNFRHIKLKHCDCEKHSNNPSKLKKSSIRVTSLDQNLPKSQYVNETVSDVMISQILERGQKLRNAMVKSVLEDGVDIVTINSNSELNQAKKTHIKLEAMQSRAAKPEDNLVDFLLGKDLKDKEEDMALDTLRRMSPITDLVEIADQICRNDTGHTVRRKKGGGRPRVIDTTACKNDTDLFPHMHVMSMFRKDQDDSTKAVKEQVGIMESKSICDEKKGKEDVIRRTKYLRITMQRLCLNLMGIQRVLVSSWRSYLGPSYDTMSLAPPSVTYFVEYEVPHLLTTLATGSTQNARMRPWITRVQRFCSKKQVGQNVYFHQHSVHRLASNKSNFQELLDCSILNFKVYTRHLNQRVPSLLGETALSLAELLELKTLGKEEDLSLVGNSTASKHPMTLGLLRVKVELGPSQTCFGSRFVRPHGSSESGSESESISSSDHEPRGVYHKPPPSPKQEDLESSKSATEKQSCPGNAMELSTPQLKADPSKTVLLRGLLRITEGRGFRYMSSSYLVCRSFWKEDIMTSEVCWDTDRPCYDFRKLMPVLLSGDLLERCHNNFLVTEVWAQGGLLGIAKLPLNQFYVAYRDPVVAEQLMLAKYPVMGVDGWVNVVDPSNGRPTGQLFVVLAMGTESQVQLLATSVGETTTLIAPPPSPALASEPDSDPPSIPNMSVSKPKEFTNPTFSYREPTAATVPEQSNFRHQGMDSSRWHSTRNGSLAKQVAPHWQDERQTSTNPFPDRQMHGNLGTTHGMEGHSAGRTGLLLETVEPLQPRTSTLLSQNKAESIVSQNLYQEQQQHYFQEQQQRKPQDLDNALRAQGYLQRIGRNATVLGNHCTGTRFVKPFFENTEARLETSDRLETFDRSRLARSDLQYSLPSFKQQISSDKSQEKSEFCDASSDSSISDHQPAGDSKPWSASYQESNLPIRLSDSHQHYRMEGTSRGDRGCNVSPRSGRESVSYRQTYEGPQNPHSIDIQPTSAQNLEQSVRLNASTSKNGIEVNNFLALVQELNIGKKSDIPEITPQACLCSRKQSQAVVSNTNENHTEMCSHVQADKERQTESISTVEAERDPCPNSAITQQNEHLEPPAAMEELPDPSKAIRPCLNISSFSQSRVKEDAMTQTELHKDNSFRARIEVVSAMHLPMVGSGIPPSSYVTFQPDQGSCSTTVATPVVPQSTNPTWHWSCETMLSSQLLQNETKRLILKLWHKGTDTSRHPDTIQDVVVGFAAMDLSVLLFGMPWISGWFNISDFTGRCKGQIRINVTPLENLSRFDNQEKIHTQVSYEKNHCKTSKNDRLLPVTNCTHNLSEHAIWTVPRDVAKTASMVGNGSDMGGFQECQQEVQSCAHNIQSSKDILSAAGSERSRLLDAADPEEDFADMSSSFLSRALKQKLSEMDEITQRLKRRLESVTNDDDITLSYNPWLEEAAHVDSLQIDSIGPPSSYSINKLLDHELEGEEDTVNRSDQAYSGQATASNKFTVSTRSTYNTEKLQPKSLEVKRVDQQFMLQPINDTSPDTQTRKNGVDTLQIQSNPLCCKEESAEDFDALTDHLMQLAVRETDLENVFNPLLFQHLVSCYGDSQWCTRKASPVPHCDERKYFEILSPADSHGVLTTTRSNEAEVFSMDRCEKNPKNNPALSMRVNKDGVQTTHESENDARSDQLTVDDRVQIYHSHNNPVFLQRNEQTKVSSSNISGNYFVNSQVTKANDGHTASHSNIERQCCMCEAETSRRDAVNPDFDHLNKADAIELTRTEDKNNITVEVDTQSKDKNRMMNSGNLAALDSKCFRATVGKDSSAHSSFIDLSRHYDLVRTTPSGISTEGADLEILEEIVKKHQQDVMCNHSEMSTTKQNDDRVTPTEQDSCGSNYSSELDILPSSGSSSESLVQNVSRQAPDGGNPKEENIRNPQKSAQATATMDALYEDTGGHESQKLASVLIDRAEIQRIAKIFNPRVKDCGMKYSSSKH